MIVTEERIHLTESELRDVVATVTFLAETAVNTRPFTPPAGFVLAPVQPKPKQISETRWVHTYVFTPA